MKKNKGFLTVILMATLSFILVGCDNTKPEPEPEPDPTPVVVVEATPTEAPTPTLEPTPTEEPTPTPEPVDPLVENGIADWIVDGKFDIQGYGESLGAEVLIFEDQFDYVFDESYFIQVTLEYDDETELPLDRTALAIGTWGVTEKFPDRMNLCTHSIIFDNETYADDDFYGGYIETNAESYQKIPKIVLVFLPRVAEEYCADPSSIPSIDGLMTPCAEHGFEPTDEDT